MEAPFSLESFKMTIPEEYEWPINEMWEYHMGNPDSEFNTFEYMSPAMEERYGEGTSIMDFLEKG